MRIGYFGGSFDPPHRGHLGVLRTVCNEFLLDRLLLVPSASQPLKPGGPVASYADRFAMVSLLCANLPREISCEVSRLEAPKADGTPHYTSETLLKLNATLAPADTLFAIVGADTFLDLRRWREPERLLELAEWIVVSRPGFSLSQLDSLHLTQQQQSRVHLLQTLDDPSSATRIRAGLSAVDTDDGSLPPAVRAYIYDNHLYGT